jgi:hypothetical protein
MKNLMIFSIFFFILIFSLAFFTPNDRKQKKNCYVEVTDIPGIKDRIESWLKNSANNLFGRRSDNANYVNSHLRGWRTVDSLYGEVIRASAREKGIPENVAIALATSESDGNPKATHRNTNGSIDRGLFGLNSQGMGAGYDEKTLFNPGVNTELALNGFADLINKYGDIKTAIIAYKIGPGKVDSLMSNGEFNKNNYGLADSVMALAEAKKGKKNESK